MSSFGILTDDFGGIDEGHQAMYLWDHGRSVVSSVTANYYEKTYVYDYPALPSNARVTVFIGMEKNKTKSRMIHYSNSRVVLSRPDSGTTAPYVYVYSTIKPPIGNVNTDYGLIVNDSKGVNVYDSKFKTMQPIETHIIPIINGSGTLSINLPSNKEVAYIVPSVYGVIVKMIPTYPGQHMTVGGIFYGRTGDKITYSRLNIQGISDGQEHPAQMFRIFEQLYGMREVPQGYGTILTLIDVTDIPKKG